MHPVRLCMNSEALGGDLVLYPSLFGNKPWKQCLTKHQLP